MFRKLLGVVLLWGHGVYGAPPPTTLSEAEISVSKALPPPPQKGSKEDRRDIEILLQFQQKRTADDCKRAEAEGPVSLVTFFGPAFGPLTCEEVEKWNPL